MAYQVRRLGPGDEAILLMLAAEDADFDIAGRGQPLQPLKPEHARRFLANPAVLHWIACEDDQVVGFLYCIELPLRAEEGYEVLLYEIGVRSLWRRSGIGRLLMETMEAWMRAHEVQVVWLGADNPGAVEFYQACGFFPDAERPLFMMRCLEPLEAAV